MLIFVTLSYFFSNGLRLFPNVPPPDTRFESVGTCALQKWSPVLLVQLVQVTEPLVPVSV